MLFRARERLSLSSDFTFRTIKRILLKVHFFYTGAMQLFRRTVYWKTADLFKYKNAFHFYSSMKETNKIY